MVSILGYIGLLGLSHWWLLGVFKQNPLKIVKTVDADTINVCLQILSFLLLKKILKIHISSWHYFYSFGQRLGLICDFHSYVRNKQKTMIIICWNFGNSSSARLSQHCQGSVWHVRPSVLHSAMYPSKLTSHHRHHHHSHHHGNHHQHHLRTSLSARTLMVDVSCRRLLYILFILSACFELSFQLDRTHVQYSPFKTTSIPMSSATCPGVAPMTDRDLSRQSHYSTELVSDGETIFHFFHFFTQPNIFKKHVLSLPCLMVNVHVWYMNFIFKSKYTWCI